MPTMHGVSTFANIYKQPISTAEGLFLKQLKLFEMENRSALMGLEPKISRLHAIVLLQYLIRCYRNVLTYDPTSNGQGDRDTW